ncbi:MAG: NADP-dependent oxidoreductase, partial [Frankiales bacterium]|nr:NADP-dependent oxidoreductase [Frankiales bacterium]
ARGRPSRRPHRAPGAARSPDPTGVWQCRPMTNNTQVRLARRPHGLPTDDVWEITTEPAPEPAEGEFVLRTEYVSLDPAMRGWMNEGRSYIPPVGIGEVMRAGVVGQVVASRNEQFPEGAHVVATTGAQEYALSDGKGVQVVSADAAPLSTYLGTLGMTGLTAYFGMLDVGQVKAGETVVVSGAAGATGSVAGQIAKIKGCRVIGIAGGEDKCRTVVEELGFDACLDYKSGDLKAGLRREAPDRINVYFDNVGGEVLNTVLPGMAMRGRVVLCGAISQYNADGGLTGPSNYMSLLVNRARMEGFVVFDYADRYGEALQEMAGWLADGSLQSRETVVEGGIRAFPQTLLRLFRGENVGKLVLKV